MDMADMDGMEMGDMNMGDGVPTPYQLQRVYWMFVGCAVAIAVAIRTLRYTTHFQRLRMAMNGASEPAKAKRFLPKVIATTTAIWRELWYSSLKPFLPRKLRLRSPTLGDFLLVSTYLLGILVICFYRMNVFDRWQWENSGYRTGYIATAQLPLVYMLAAKNNIIGFFIGKSYERLNWLHRWTARVLFITATVHMIFWFKTWAQYDYILIKLQGDKITQRGFAAWVILLWIFVSSLYPVRSHGYEFFVIQHLVTMAGFSGAIYLHLPDDMKCVFWIAIAFPIFDRIMRLGRTLWLNFRVRSVPFQWPRIGHSTTFERLPGGVTRITVDRPSFSWKPGQHVFMSCHGLLPLQSHPFTISSLPQDGKLVLIAKAHKGGTHKMYKQAQEELPLLEGESGQRQYRAIFEGPYGSNRPLVGFDSVAFLAGSTGSTFTIPLLRHLIGSTTKCTRHIRFIWVIKSRSQISWFARELNRVADSVAALRRGGHESELIISVYITCDDEVSGPGPDSIVPKGELPTPAPTYEEKPDATCVLTTEHEAPTDSKFNTDAPKKGCQPDGTCCCTEVVDEGEPAISECTCNCGSTDEPLAEETQPVTKNDCLSSGSECSPRSEPKVLPAGHESLHSSIKVLSGRPNVRNLIRATLEQAGGESAVVVCGPHGLVDDTRHAVVALSDERAVHKGTGAQGIYLHTEAFSY